MAAKSQPINIRMSKDLQRRVNAMAKRTGMSRSALLESLIDEAERERRYPGIRFRGREQNRRAWVIGTGLDVWQIIEALQDFGNDAERMARDTDLTLACIELARAYYGEFTEEIDSAIALDRRPLAELTREYPFFKVLLVDV
ncbi:MAG TPA: ribbon-helix-helix protein, CopG family [Chloroflexota bacterium]